MTNLLRPKDIQEYFKCSRGNAYKIINIKGFPVTRIGKNYYIQQDAFEQWLKENTRTHILFKK